MITSSGESEKEVFMNFSFFAKSAERQTAKKPRYHTGQNCLFMLRLGKKECPSIFFTAAALIVLNTGLRLLELFTAPALLNAVQTSETITQMLGTVLLFSSGTIAVSALIRYLNIGLDPKAIQVRTGFKRLLDLKQAQTSFCNMQNPDFFSAAKLAGDAVCDNQSAGEAIWSTLIQLFTSLFCFLAYLMILTGIRPVLLLLTAAASAVSYLIGNYMSDWKTRHRDEQNEASKILHYLNKQLRDPKAAKDIRIFGLQPWLNDLYRQAFGRLMNFRFRVEQHEFCGSLADVLLVLLRSGAAYGYLIYEAASGHMDAPEFLLCFTAVSGFGSWIANILSQCSALHRQSADLSAAREFLEFPEPFLFENGKPLSVRPDDPVEIILKDVSFRYPNAAKDTLSHINLTLHPGEKLAVVGLNGAGKSTLIKLICGFLDPTEGTVLLNGQDIRQYNRRDYYKCFSAVFQEFSLLAATVAENVAQSLAPDRALVSQCLKKADLEEKIQSLPQGMDTHLERSVYLDAAELSGGQLQKLMLARALYKNSPVLLLDEPTAALDPIAESNIYQMYQQLTAGRSSVYISHRLASTRFCDRILLLENHRIAEEGTHEELLQLGERYAELFDVQKKYYQESGSSSGNDVSKKEAQPYEA